MDKTIVEGIIEEIYFILRKRTSKGWCTKHFPETMASATNLSIKILYNQCGLHQLDLKLQLFYKAPFIVEDDVAPENERDLTPFQLV